MPRALRGTGDDPKTSESRLCRASMPCMRIAVLRAAERCPPFTVQRLQADLRERLSNSDDVDSSRRSRPKPGLALLAFRPVGPTKSPRAPASSGRLRSTRISPLTLRSPQHNAKLADRPKSSESGAHLDEEQHAQSLEPDRLNCEEINGEQALSIRPVPGPPFQRGDAALAPLSRSRGPVRSATGLT